MPYTAATKQSLVEHVLNEPDGHLYVKPATWFVSHAWSYLYLDVVDALDDFFPENDLEDSVAVWFCTFCNNQHEIESQCYDFDYWFDIFIRSLRSIGNVVMVMSPWNNPTTLTRTWCVFEVYASIVENARFEIAMGRSQKASFLHDIQNDGAFIQMLATIHSEKSQTTIPSDRDNIFKLIRKEVGFQKLDRMVFEALEKWMLRTVEKQIDDAKSLETKAAWLYTKAEMTATKGFLYRATIASYECYDIYRQEKGDNFVGTWKALSQLAMLKMYQGYPFEEVEPMFLNALDHLTELLSRSHEDTLQTMHYMGTFYVYNQKYDLAMPLLKECFELQCQHFGEEHVNTRVTMTSICSTLRCQNQFEEALEWSIRCYDVETRMFGEDYPEAYRTRHEMGLNYQSLGDFARAEVHFDAALQDCRRMYGLDHVKTQNIESSLADIYFLQGRYADAKEIFLQSLRDDSTHIHTKQLYSVKLGLLHLATQDTDRAKECLDEAVAHLRAEGWIMENIYVFLTGLFLLKMKTGQFTLLDEINSFEKDLDDATWSKDVWKDCKCSGCYDEIHGDLYTCSECPPDTLLYCQECVTLKKNEVHCKHSGDRIRSDKPPLRYLQEERLKILAKNSDWDEYERRFLMYEAFCDEQVVPSEARLARYQREGD
ncbi:hypothetical protein Ae201684_008048 [Aphanomyces euteiches]|uniref:Uncharacterized protein n=1 Tax=Aphanomyces euteiches TaxID=100861 RepID=A0A6G0X6H5_9STRA|nr:hypothetical protein Ae201684_008048 [Aphanomyces euteiches]